MRYIGVLDGNGSQFEEIEGEGRESLGKKLAPTNVPQRSETMTRAETDILFMCNNNTKASCKS